MVSNKPEPPPLRKDWVLILSFAGHCRRRKIRCLIANSDPTGHCANCIRLKKECNFYPVEQNLEPQHPQAGSAKEVNVSDHPPPPYPHTIDTQWPSATGSLPSSSPYRWPSSTINSAYEGDPNVSGGHTPTAVSTPSFGSYHGGPNWGQPNLQLPSKFEEKGEEVSSEPKKVETNSADIDEGVTLAKTTILDIGFVSECGESSLEGTTLLDTNEAPVARAEYHAVLDSDKGIEDYMSLPSNDEDIASQALRQRTEQEILAVRLFSLFFAESKELGPLHKNALGKLGPSRFLENCRRILKTYVLKLRVEARTALEKDAIKVIASRRNRSSIAKQIMTLLAEENEENVKPLDRLVELPLMKQNLEDWARTAYGLPDAILDTVPEQAEYSSEESDEEEDGDDNHENEDKEHIKTLTFTNIEKAYHFLQTSAPFHTLILQLRLLGLPTSLREIIETSPKCSIKISANNDTSFMNRTKGIIEAYTAIQWDWWPLAPQVPDVAPDRLRLEWRVSRRSPGTYCTLTR